MSVFRSKRPSSARRNIKQETFSPFVSGTRLRHVQNLLKDGAKSKLDYPDAILCIAGIDGRYNDGMLELINYLLFGFFEVRKAELEGSGFDEEVIDDVMLLIQRDQVDVYCNPVNYHYLLPYVSHWRNVFFHCLRDVEYADEEAAEDFKITTFVNIVKNCHKIGIPYSNSANVVAFDKMAIEKWPIIQVYGVEGVGGGGFFTMNHDVVDISDHTSKLYQLMDPVMLETVIIEQSSKLERQWNNMLSTEAITLTGGGQSNVTEDKLFEPLRSFYVHGRAGASGDKVSDNVPYVLFGTNTRKEVLQKVMKGGNSPGSDLRSTTVGANGANFMVCKAVSPRGPVTCSRTYFFNREFVNPFQDAKIVAYDKNIDLRILTILYSALIDSVLSSIHTYSETFSVSQAENTARLTLLECCTSIIDGVVTKYLKDKPQIEFYIVTVDNEGRYGKLQDRERSLMAKCVSMTIFDIPSSERPGSTLGSLVFSESFLDSTIKVTNIDGGMCVDSNYLLLTDQIPRHRTWSYTDVESERQALRGKLEGDSLGDHFGKLLISGEPVHLGSRNILCVPPEEAMLHAFENGLVIVAPNYGAIVLHGNHIKSTQFYDGDSSNTVAVLVIEYHPTFVPFIPFHLQNEACEIMLLFTPKTKAYQHLYSEILHSWKQDTDSPKIDRVQELPDGCQLLHSLLQHQFITAQPSTTTVKTALQKAAVSMPYLNSFLNHFAASSVDWHPIPEQDLGKVLKNSADLQEDYQKDVEVLVTILAGVPGSHQDKLCDVLSGLSKDQNRYVVLKPPLDGSQMFSQIDLQAKLKATLNVHRRRKSQLSSRNTRVLYIVPGYTDIVNVVQAIECHPDPEVRTHCAIGSVTTCLDPLNTFMEHMYTLPCLLNMCAQGWVNQIIMTSSTSLQNEELGAIQHMVRSVNSNMAFLLAEKGQISRSMDIDAVLSEDSFNQADQVRARHLLCPGWTQGMYKPGTSRMTTIQLKFNLPLDRLKLTSKLRGLKSSHVSFPFSGNVYYIQGKVRFVGVKSEETQELRYTVLSGSLELHPLTETAKDKAANPGNFISFSGIELTQAKLKDWLRDCAPQKPVKKPYLTRKDLSYDLRKKIHKEHHLDPLPEGWFYNGTQYVSFDGSKQETHPESENFIRAYMDEKNAEIEKQNAKVEELINSYQDLFSD